ncbi:NAD-dependent epimerase/dehydratase family protein [Pseudoxanthomonas sp. PXM01]|uniref:NAD-dependent epimerase/dehydratase family protein n=1 Tax=Pseudoxanthomonas sp. PXM01 TaxID=2769295 RepID=UPI00177F3723|nr:NAD-dependent epimerase/dehydratase family protein [Pseudoxanthomonas sp. PXM01]MBD9468934.1 NAD-dependent epimerase/dehydratase family protein [Pseudoxanthomonas sp. PXM01]
MRTALVFGASGQIGEALLARLDARDWQVFAVSRMPRPDASNVRWLRGEFAGIEGLPAVVDVIFSTGPLDGFAWWYERGLVATPRVVAFGSTSLDTKQASGDAYERDIVARLQAAERLVFDTAAANGASATLLRPTLVYGAGRDQTLARIAAMARRTRFFVLPRGADGKRQPVHVDDLAAAALAVVDAPTTHGQAYALPGGETLAYRDMVARTLAALEPPATLWQVPMPMFRMALSLARLAGVMRGLTDDAVARMREDLVFDATPARRDFGYAPKPFELDANALGRKVG